MERLFSTEPSEQFEKVSLIVLDNLYETDERNPIESDVIEGAKHDMRQLIADCNFDLDEVAAMIKTRPYDQNKINLFVTALQERRTNLLYTILAHNNSAHGETLTNFNWIMKLVLGTSELKSLRYPLLQLVLNTKSNNGKEIQNVYELNKEILGKMISVLEDIQ